jgi:hypothetical protein
MKLFHIISSIVLASAVFIVGYYMGTAQADEASQAMLSSEAAQIMIDNGDDTLTAYTDENVQEGDTVFDSLVRLQANGDIELVYEDYGGEMGVFLKGINGVGVDEKQSGSKWWHYWVNGSYAQVGVSSQEIYPGDVVLFKYMPAQERAVNE